jgi:hypothetical protein
MLGGVWEQGARDASGGVAGSFSGRRNEHGRRSWDDCGARGGQGLD